MSHTNQTSDHSQLITDQQVTGTIKYYSNHISRVFKLNRNDKEDITQDLTVAGLEAIQAHRLDMKAKCRTYAKNAIKYQAIDIMRKMENAPKTVCHEDGFDLEQQERFHRRVERDFHDELSKADPDPEKKDKRLQFNCGSYIEEVAVAPNQPDPGLRLDILNAMKQLNARQYKICQMLMDGKSIQDISSYFRVDKSTISRAIKSMQPVFQKLCKASDF